MSAADELRDRLRHDLRAAMKSRDPETVSALRALIAAVDNAEAVQPGSPPLSAGAIAHSSPGIGSAEVPRRELSAADLGDIVRDLVTEHHSQAVQYRALHQDDAAGRLDRAAAVLRTYLY